MRTLNQIIKQWLNKSILLGALLFVSATLFAAETKTTTTKGTATSGSASASSANTAKTQQATQASIPVNDPFEAYNRQIFTFNMHFDEAVMKPVATFYNTIMPKPLNQGIHNFFVNINQLPAVANDLLQLRFQQALNDSWRFVVNATLGIGGLFDVASRIGLNLQQNDFGLTLARWGYRQSMYIVLPIVGGMTFRDMLGVPVDYYGFSIYPYIDSDYMQDGLYLLSMVDKRAQFLSYQSVIEEVSVDKYVFIRDAYLQRRNYQLEQT